MRYLKADNSSAISYRFMCAWNTHEDTHKNNAKCVLNGHQTYIADSNLFFAEPKAINIYPRSLRAKSFQVTWAAEIDSFTRRSLMFIKKLDISVNPHSIK